MARATTKIDLVDAANGQFEKLWEVIDSMCEAQQHATFGERIMTAGKEAHWQRDKNMRDVLVHLYEWHQLLLNWVNANRIDDPEPFLPPPYNWKTYGAMNIAFWMKHQNTPLDEAKAMLKDSHLRVMRLIEMFSNDELFAKKVFKWTGTSTLGAYCISTTASHYDWAIRKLKMHPRLGKKEE